MEGMTTTTRDHMRYIRIIVTLLLCVAPLAELSAQHTIGVSAGGTVSVFRPYPTQETRNVEGLYTSGVSWRYYTSQRFVGAIGLDLEFMQRGYSFAPFASASDEADTEYSYYTRRYNSIMLPFIWQPHFYLFNYHVRIFLDAAATFCYNTSGTYVNDAYKDYGYEIWEGDYEHKTARDNRFGYGLMGGVGINLIFGRYEIMARGRYYFGYSDILKNRNKYYGNSNDGSENPFYYTPTRSPIDNISISVGLNYRLGSGDGFDSWKIKPRSKLNIGTDFNYIGDSDSNKDTKK